MDPAKIDVQVVIGTLRWAKTRPDGTKLITIPLEPHECRLMDLDPDEKWAIRIEVKP